MLLQQESQGQQCPSYTLSQPSSNDSETAREPWSVALPLTHEVHVGLEGLA